MLDEVEKQFLLKMWFLTENMVNFSFLDYLDFLA